MLAYLNSSVDVKVKYDSTADSYDELYRDEQYAKYNVIELNELMPSKGDRVLDAGCGTCLFYEYLAEDRVQGDYVYVGVDISINMLLKCINKDLYISPKVDLVQADILNIPFRANSFNKIYLITVLDLLDRSVSEVIDMVKQVAKKNSLIVYTLLKKKGCTEGIEGSLNVKDCIYYVRV